jgi:hypothetical protein
MQIHELTQPRKIKLDEVDWVGPDSVFAQAKSAWKTGGRSLVSHQADQEAQQARYQDYAANAIAKGKEQGLDQKPTLDSALAKLKTNPVAKQWIDSIVAKWPAVAKQLAATASPTTPTTDTPTINEPVMLGGKKLDPKNPNDAQVLAAMTKQGIKEAPEYTTPGGIVVPANAKTAQAPKTPTTDNRVYANSIKEWINSQLGTIDLKTVEAGVPELTTRIEKLVNQIVSLTGDIPAQQKVLHDIFALATAANHVIDWERRTSGGNNLRYQARLGKQGQSTQVGLTSTQLRDLGILADQSGGPDPRPTGNEFWDNLIKQAMGSR